MTRPRHPPTGRGEPARRSPEARVERPGAKAENHAAPRQPTTTRLRTGPDLVLIWGFHAALEALRSPRRDIVYVLATAAAAERLAADLSARDLTPEIATATDMDARLPRDAVHQGIALQAKPLEEIDLDDVPDQGTVLVLDQITDPHNVGAILRTAAAFGVTALVTTERHAPEMTGVLAKSASGGMEHVPIVSVVNLARALEALGRRGFQLIGLDSDGSLPLDEVRVDAAVALVLGAEGKGLRRLTRERCDVVARLDMPGAIKSLNVSNACAVALATLRSRSGRA